MTYQIKSKITTVSGWQFWSVEASSPAEAIAKWQAGDAEFENEEVEVIDVGEPEIYGEEKG